MLFLFVYNFLSWRWTEISSSCTFTMLLSYLFPYILKPVVELVRNVMAHTQKPDLVFQRNGRVHLNRRGFQFSRLLAADACASAVVMLDRPSSDTVQDCWLPTPLAYFPFTSPPVRHRVPSDSERAIRLTHLTLYVTY